MKKYAVYWILGALLILQGCGAREVFTGAETGGELPKSPSAPASSVQLPAPSADSYKMPDVVPHLEVSVGGTTFEAQTGSFCWSDNKKGIGVCADAAAMPPSFEDVKVKPFANAGDEIALAWSGDPPDSVHSIAYFPGTERPVEAIELRDGKLRVAAGKGDQLYEVTATWPQGTVPFFFGIRADAEENAANAEEADSALRKLAWEAMPESDRASVVGDWWEAEIDVPGFHPAGLSAVDGEGEVIELPSADPEQLRKVTFHTKNEPKLGPMVAVIDRESRDLLGWLLRD
ncbi:hypothetical protein [Cohnella hashimotonis]|uniref:Uncharacterized protein n=1 Tax=Cohnella hashimotonis TaxID=2826895 RepID=A0ABT6TBJ1_9BACL|nr:hypothetical protein [Cohnella hashimotonis]MDI4644211.1 hypothetical protein [Cohnella hashimotonis]